MKAKRKDQAASVDHPLFDRPSEPLLRTGGRLPTHTGPRLDWRQALGGAFIVGGFISLVAGYIGISGTKETYDQLTYFLSNGLGGAAAIVVGSTILVIREHVADRQAMQVIDERLCFLEEGLRSDAGAPAGSRDSSVSHARPPAGRNGTLAATTTAVQQA